MGKMLKKVEYYISKIETYVLVIGLITMIIAGTTQVILRNFFNTGLEWGDMLARSLVLWVGFVGASLATRRSKHINIELMSKFITNPKLSKIRERVVNIIALFISTMLAIQAIIFTHAEAQDNMTAFLKVPTWVIFIIVPISLCLISIRFLIEVITGHRIEETEL
jgi:TRAP-type C4-dicarboxylate transport system permease small subunit